MGGRGGGGGGGGAGGVGPRRWDSGAIDDDGGLASRIPGRERERGRDEKEIKREWYIEGIGKVIHLRIKIVT